MTPEGKIKRAVKKVLAKYPDAYVFMPVVSGFGRGSLDYLICFHGKFIAVETKAPGKKPTPRQRQMIAQIERTDGQVLVIDTEKGAQELGALMSSITCEASLP
jgi:hypothetical protein